MNADPVQIAFLASFPPPFGGVATHVVRLSNLLDSRNVSYRIYNATSEVEDPPRIVSVHANRKQWLLRYIFSARERLIYILSDRVSAWLAGALMAVLRGKRIAIRLRNSSLIDWIEGSPAKRMLAGWALRRCSAVVCVSEALADATARVGVPRDRILWVPGFLPPVREPGDRDDVAPEVWEFIADHGPVLSANGKVAVYNGEDLYGLDNLVELVARLKPDHPDIGLVICFWAHMEREQGRVEELKRRASELGVRENILFNTKPAVFIPVLAESDVFLRPTNTDGDANSIREALWMGVPAVASDIVSRPKGCITFTCRNVDDFEEKVRTALKAGPQPPEVAGFEAEDRKRVDSYLSLLTRLAS